MELEVALAADLKALQERREAVILALYELADELDGHHHRLKIAKTSLAAGGIVGSCLAIGGVVLAPVTLGASLGFTVAGTAIGVSSGIGGLASHMTERVLNSKTMKMAKREADYFAAARVNVLKVLDKTLEEDEFSFYTIVQNQLRNIDPTFYREIITAIATGGSQKSGKSDSFVKMFISAGIAAGKLVTDACDAANSCARVAKSAAAVGGVVVAAVSIPLDIATIVSNSISIHKQTPAETAEVIRHLVTELQGEIDEMTYAACNEEFTQRFEKLREEHSRTVHVIGEKHTSEGRLQASAAGDVISAKTLPEYQPESEQLPTIVRGTEKELLHDTEQVTEQDTLPDFELVTKQELLPDTEQATEEDLSENEKFPENETETSSTDNRPERNLSEATRKWIETLAEQSNDAFYETEILAMKNDFTRKLLLKVNLFWLFAHVLLATVLVIVNRVWLHGKADWLSCFTGLGVVYDTFHLATVLGTPVYEKWVVSQVKTKLKIYRLIARRICKLAPPNLPTFDEHMNFDPITLQVQLKKTCFVEIFLIIGKSVFTLSKFFYYRHLGRTFDVLGNHPLLDGSAGGYMLLDGPISSLAATVGFDQYPQEAVVTSDLGWMEMVRTLTILLIWVCLTASYIIELKNFSSNEMSFNIINLGHDFETRINNIIEEAGSNAI